MAETAESYCIRLKLHDGGQVYVESVWRSASYAITVLDGARAWNHSEMQVKDIARFWGMSVSNFMRIARSRLSVQHPTATYFLILADTCDDTVQLSCTMDDVRDGDLLKLEVRLKKMQNLGAVVCGMLDLLIDTTSKLKEHILNTEYMIRRQAQWSSLDMQNTFCAPDLDARVMLGVECSEQINTEDSKRPQLARQVILPHPERISCTRFGSQSDIGGPEDALPAQEPEAAGSILLRFSCDREDQLLPYSQAPRRLSIRDPSKISILQPSELQLLGNSIEATTRIYTDMNMDTMSYKKLQRSPEEHHSRCSCHDVVTRERLEVPLAEHVVRVLNRLGPPKCKKESSSDRSHGQGCSAEIMVGKNYLQGWDMVRSTDHLSSAHVEKALQTSITELCGERFKSVHVHDLPSTSRHRQGAKNLDDFGCVDASIPQAAAGVQRKKMPSSTVPTRYNSLVEDIPTSTNSVECLGRKIKTFASSLRRIVDTSNLTTKEQLTQPVDGSFGEDFPHGRRQINEPPSNIPDGSPIIINPDGCRGTLYGVQLVRSSDNLPSHNRTDVESIIDVSGLLGSLVTAPTSDVANVACGGDANTQATGGGPQSSISQAWQDSYEKRINPCATTENVINTISRSAGDVRVKETEDMSRGEEVVPAVHKNYSREIPHHGNNLNINRADYIEDTGENEHSASMIADHHESAVDGPGTNKKVNINVTNEDFQGSSHKSLSHRSTNYCKVTEKLHERQSSGADTMFERPCRRSSDSVSIKERPEGDSGNTTSSTGCFQIVRRPRTDTIAMVREETKELNTIRKASTSCVNDIIVMDCPQIEESNVNSHCEDSIPSGCGQEKHGIPIAGEAEGEDRSKQIEEKQSSIRHHLGYTFRRLGTEYIGQAQWKEWLQEAKTGEKENSWKEYQESAATRDELSNKESDASRNEVELKQLATAEITASLAARKSNEVDANIQGLDSPPIPDLTDKTEETLAGNSNLKTRPQVGVTTRSEGKARSQTELELLRTPVKEVKKESFQEIGRIRRHGTIAEQMALINWEDEKKTNRETKPKDDSNDSHKTKDFSRKIPALGDVSKRKRKGADHVPDYQVAKRKHSSGDIETHVPDADHYEFDKDRTESHVKINQVWALYDDIDGMPRNWAHIQRVLHSPQFKAWVSWLKPHNPSLQTQQWKESTGYTVPCGHFKAGKPDILTGINCFSHLMVVDWEADDVVHIYPRKGEVWALFKKGTFPHNSSEGAVSDKPIAVPKFRLVEILANIDGGRPMEIQVLGKVPGFRTIWGPSYAKGALPRNSMRLFSHRVPAYRLQGGEYPKIPENCWDIDPAGVPPAEN